MYWLLFGLAVSAPGRAEARGRLSWSAACLDRAQAERELAAQSSWARVPSSFAAHVEIAPSGEGYRATISLRAAGRSYVRELRDASCIVLAHAATTVVALALEQAAPEHTPVLEPENEPPIQRIPDADLDLAPEHNLAPEPEPEPEPEPALSTDADRAALHPDRSPLPASFPSPTPVVRPRHPLRGSLGVTAAVAAGAIPAPSFPLGVHAELAWRSLRMRGRLSYLFPRAADRIVAVRTEVGLLVGTLELGAAISRAAFECPLLIGVETGRLRARSEGAVAQRDGRATWLALQLAAELRYRVHPRLVVLLRAQGSRALHRPRFAIADPEGSPLVFHRPAPLAGQLAFGVEVRFW